MQPDDQEPGQKFVAMAVTSKNCFVAPLSAQAWVYMGFRPLVLLVGGHFRHAHGQCAVAVEYLVRNVEVYPPTAPTAPSPSPLPASLQKAQLALSGTPC